jgi:hypothetical protein
VSGSRPGSRAWRALAALGRAATFYLLAAAVETTVFSLTRPSHADVPFTRFPEFLILSPVAPFLIAQSLLERPAVLEAVSTLVFVVVFVSLWLAQRHHVLRGRANK